MKKVNDSINHPLHYILDDGRIFGQFYNSWERMYHLAEYIPYKKLPGRYLCGGGGNFSSSRSDFPDQNRCAVCWGKLEVEDVRKTAQEELKIMLVDDMLEAFPGLRDGETDVNGGDLVQFITLRIRQKGAVSEQNT